ncbi:hypothetical protein BS17DRAFT_767389 [Gyrodon lividus]|nr:hypothetical protein BS17DRAFT_767389 [Gyrodon lividus]
MMQCHVGGTNSTFSLPPDLSFSLPWPELSANNNQLQWPHDQRGLGPDLVPLILTACPNIVTMKTQKNPNPTQSVINTATTDPLATGGSSQGQNVVHNVCHFFGRMKVILTVTSQSILIEILDNYIRGHLNSIHPLLYLNKMEGNNWPLCASLIKAAFNRGYMYNTLQQALSQPGVAIDNLPPPPPPGEDNKVPIRMRPKTDNSMNLPEFLVETLQELLLEFIIIDDQSANKLNLYIAITAHWISQDSQGEHSNQLYMKTMLIAFHKLPAAHTSEEIAKVILYLIDHAKMPMDKICHYTMDNAVNNNTALSALAWILQDEREVEFNPTTHCIHCFPHIMNIYVQQIISNYSHADLSDVPSSWGNAPRVLKKAHYVKALQEDPLHHGRETMFVVRTPYINLCTMKCKFNHPEVGLDALGKDLEFVLYAPAMAHHMITSKHTPLLSGALPAYEMFLEWWKHTLSSTTNPQFSPILSEGVAYAEQYHQLMHGNSTYVIAMLLGFRVVHPAICWSKTDSP